VILDVGATVEPGDDCGLRVMAAPRADHLENRCPSGLLSNGTEREGAAGVEANAKLSSLKAERISHRNVEGSTSRGTADVWCDGFVGNVCLKIRRHHEVAGLAKYAYKEKLLWRAGSRCLGGFEKSKRSRRTVRRGSDSGSMHLIKAHGR